MLQRDSGEENAQQPWAGLRKLRCCLVSIREDSDPCPAKALSGQLGVFPWQNHKALARPPWPIGLHVSRCRDDMSCSLTFRKLWR